MLQPRASGSRNGARLHTRGNSDRQQGGAKGVLMRATSPGMTPQQLRAAMQESRDIHMRARRGIFAVSLLGIASMGAVGLYQLGAIRHLPDPPTRRNAS